MEMPSKSNGKTWLAGSNVHYTKRKNQRRFAPVQDKRYSTARWRKFSKWFRSEHPVCATPSCDNLSRVTDHITPVEDGGDFWNGPFQALCHSCHNRKSSAEAARRRLNNR